jgi:hypothetical protein
VIDWRTWVYQTLIADAALTAVVPADYIFGAGGIEERPGNPQFVVITFGDDLPGPVSGVVETLCQVWAHDEPGDYLMITSILGLVRGALRAVRSPGFEPHWNGDSPELSNPEYHTFVRFGTYTLRGSA